MFLDILEHCVLVGGGEGGGPPIGCRGVEHLGEVQLAEHILHQLGRSNTATALVHRLFGEFSEISVFGGQFLLKNEQTPRRGSKRVGWRRLRRKEAQMKPSSDSVKTHLRNQKR